MLQNTWNSSSNLQLQLEHSQLNAIIDLSGVVPYVALCFDEEALPIVLNTSRIL